MSSDQSKSQTGHDNAAEWLADRLGGDPEDYDPDVEIPDFEDQEVERDA